MANRLNRFLNGFLYIAIGLLFLGLFLMLMDYLFAGDTILILPGILGTTLGMGMIFILGLGSFIYAILGGIIDKMQQCNISKDDILDDDFK